jgi:hypothetical protein
VLDRRLHASNSATPGDSDKYYLEVIRAALVRTRLEENS